jgi:hypothetical protein
VKRIRDWTLLLAMSALAVGCHRPTAEDRDNRRLLDQILTAVTLANSRLLEDAAQRAKDRHDAGQIADDDYRALDAIITQGRAKDWSGASAAGYAFRKVRPFVRSGQ